MWDATLADLLIDSLSSEKRLTARGDELETSLASSAPLWTQTSRHIHLF